MRFSADRLCLASLTIFFSAELTLFVTGVTIAGEAVKIPNYFPLVLGAWWKYKNMEGTSKPSHYVLTVTKETTERKGRVAYVMSQILDPGPPEYDVFIKETGTIYQAQASSILGGTPSISYYEPPAVHVKTQLDDKSTWNWNGKIRLKVPAGEDVSPHRCTSTVSGPAEIEVPAGKFKTMKVTSIEVVEGPGSSYSRETHWFADGVGEVKGESVWGPLIDEVGNKVVRLKYPKNPIVVTSVLTEYFIPTSGKPLKPAPKP